MGRTFSRRLPVLLAVAAVSVLAFSQVTAQAPEEAPAERSPDVGLAVVEPAALPNVKNADTIDNKHAVGPTSDRAKRAGKLVATNRYGYLPGNIIKVNWSGIVGMPEGFADGTDDGGLEGPQGEPGPQGPEGPQGPKGEPGPGVVSAAFVLDMDGTKCDHRALRIDHPLANDKPGAIIVVTPLGGIPIADPPRIWVAYGESAGSGCVAGYWHVVSEPLVSDFNVIVANP